MKAFASVTVAFLALGSLVALPAAAQGTITSAGGVTFVEGTSPFDISPDVNFVGVSSVGAATDQLFETGWYFRVAGDTQETFFPVPTTQSYVGDTATLTWTDVGARGLFSAQLVWVVTGTNVVPRSGTVTGTMTVTNLSASTPLTLSLFNMTDVDLQPTAGNDSAVAQTPSSIHITHVSNVDFVDVTGFGSDGYMVRPFGATDVGTVLSNATVDDFTSTGLPFAPGDITMGFEWMNRVIPASGQLQVTLEIGGNVAVLSVELTRFQAD